MTIPVIISVAPNGALKSKADHPNLPLTLDEIAVEAKRCVEKGATMLHLHVRDRNQLHTLDPEIYLTAIKRIKTAVGDSLVIQITTEAIGQYSTTDQIDCVKKVEPEAVSLALRELIPNQKEELRTARFIEWMYRQGVAPQYILYSEDDLKRFNELCARGIIQSDTPNILLVLGKKENTGNDNSHSDPATVSSFASMVDPMHVWSLCAFGASEAECMAKAISLGGHCRVGFENNLFGPDGEHAANNGQQVANIADKVLNSTRTLANISDTRRLFNIVR